MTTINTKNIKAVVTDFDGVLTDNKVYVGTDGTEFVVCSEADSYAISRLREKYRVAVLTAETDASVQYRCHKLNIECIVCTTGKLARLVEWCYSYDISLSDVVYIGNSEHDIGCLRECGLGLAVSDATIDAIDACDHVLWTKGGDGVMDEVLDILECGACDE